MDQAEPIAENRVLTFHATRMSFARLLFINSLLTLVTIGIYRFWAKTAVRRYFWRNVSFLDDPLEYTGTGGELFVGFLIVLAILFPLGLIYSAIGSVVPPDNQGLRVGLEIAYYIVLFALLQIGFYRMWRYRMSRTRWRGVRFGLDGSTWAYLKLASGWILLSVITLGAAYPWMKIDLWRYQVRHTRLGTESCRFEGDARALWLPWLPVFIAIVCTVAAIITSITLFGINPGASVSALPKDQQSSFFYMLVTVLITDILGALAFFYYRVRQARLQISGLRIGAASFSSRLPFWRLFVFGIISVLLIVLALAGPFALNYGLLTHSGADGTAGAINPHLLGTLFGSIALSVVVFVVAIPVVWAILFGFEVIKQMVITTHIDNPQAIEQAAQSRADAPRTGEGLADALDIGGF
ncbi:MAG: YjgN family protein [Rhodospirillales bacterium]